MKAWLFLALVAAPMSAMAQTPHVRALAATCAACHGTDGRAQPDAAMPVLAGRPKDELVAQLRAFREGTRPATVMHQIARGYTDAQIDELASWFATRSRP